LFAGRARPGGTGLAVPVSGSAGRVSGGWVLLGGNPHQGLANTAAVDSALKPAANPFVKGHEIG